MLFLFTGFEEQQPDWAAAACQGFCAALSLCGWAPCCLCIDLLCYMCLCTCNSINPQLACKHCSTAPQVQCSLVAFASLELAPAGKRRLGMECQLCTLSVPMHIKASLVTHGPCSIV